MKKIITYISIFLFALSCDVDEQVSISLPITDIDMEVPTITINQPVTDSIYVTGQTIDFDITASDDLAILAVFLEIDGIEIFLSNDMSTDSLITTFQTNYAFDSTSFCSVNCGTTTENSFIVKAWVSDYAGNTSLDWIRVEFNYSESDNHDSQ